MIPDEPQRLPTVPSHPAPIQAIPNVSLITTIGLLEILENEGEMELFALSKHVDKEFTQVLLVVKAAELLDWVVTPGQRVQMTPAGREFLAAAVTTRKRLLNAKLRHILVFDLILRLLERSENQEVDEDLVLGELAMLYPHERPQRVFRTIVAWARYAELFKYSSTRKAVYSAALDAGVASP